MMATKYLREKKGAFVEERYGQPFEKKRELQVWCGKGTILPSIDHRKRPFGNKGCVIDDEGRLVELSAINNDCQPYPAPNIQKRDERVVFCGHLSLHWGHFLTEMVVRLWYALEHDAEVDRYVFTTGPNMPHRLYPNMETFLQALGIQEKVEILDRPTAFREVIVPELSFRLDEYYSDAFVETYRRVNERLLAMAPAATTASAKKVYLSRSHFIRQNGKSEIGTTMLDEFFAQNGYRVVCPEDLSLPQLTQLLHGAEVVASPSGTIAHNILFAAPTTKVVIMEREAWVNPYQIAINRIRGGETVFVDANLSIYPQEYGFGPFIVACTPQLQQFARDHGYKEPASRYVSHQYLKQCFADYMKNYRQQYGLQWFMKDTAPDAAYLYEAYEDSLVLFGPYLRRERPYRWYHYLMPHYWRKMLGRLRRQ